MLCGHTYVRLSGNSFLFVDMGGWLVGLAIIYINFWVVGTYVMRERERERERDKFYLEQIRGIGFIKEIIGKEKGRIEKGKMTSNDSFGVPFHF